MWLCWASLIGTLLARVTAYRIYEWVGVLWTIGTMAVLVIGIARLAGRSARPATDARPRCSGRGCPLSALRPGSGRLVRPECGRTENA